MTRTWWPRFGCWSNMVRAGPAPGLCVCMLTLRVETRHSRGCASWQWLDAAALGCRQWPVRSYLRAARVGCQPQRCDVHMEVRAPWHVCGTEARPDWRIVRHVCLCVPHPRRQVFGKGSGQTPLHWASESGHADAVALLADAAVGTVVAQDEKGASPRDMAEKEGHSEVINALTVAEEEEYVCVELAMTWEGFHSAAV